MNNNTPVGVDLAKEVLSTYRTEPIKSSKIHFNLNIGHN